ncbi:membrane-bound transcription factor site-2 protease homolog isoform X2 [Phragmites australis]|nr:membrane-bound transcription factor site-2 protease homolog isoform X2 [Phragmites australis]
MLLWESIGVFYFRSGSLIAWLQNLLTSGLSLSIMDTTITIISTILSIAFHEFGHAIAAASEGVQIEYVAIFVALLFPGALVALNYDLLQNLHLFSMLRIYCAGIWHNVMLCAVCVLMTLLLPVVLYPLYVSGDGLMVVGIPQTSPLSEYLYAHDVILSVDGLKITTTDEWIKMLDQSTTEKNSGPEFLEGSQRYVATSSGKGYCVPNSWMDASKNLWQISDKLSCPDELIAFEKMICNGSVIFTEKTGRGSDQKEVEGKYCLIAKDVVKLRKCGNGWRRTVDDGSSCVCFQDEYCLVPVLTPGFSWIEVSYARPYSLGCLQKEGNLSSSHATNNNLGQSPCEGSFVYVGDLLSSARSVRLSPYRPRWALLLFIADIPYILGNGLSSLLHVSAALAVVNCLPVYFLDGEAILETGLCYVAWFTHRQQRKILKVCCFVWTVLSIITFSRILYSATLYYYGFV